MKKIINILFNDFTNDNRVLKESVSLVKAGYEVELVATKFDRELPKEENIEGIHVVRVGVGNFVFLPVNLFLFWCKVIRKYKRESVFHCNDLYALPPAFIIKKFFNKEAKIVYDCHEHETEAGIYIGKPILKWIAKIFEKMMISTVDEVITVSDSIADEYVQIYGIKKPALILNCPPYIEYSKKDLFRKELGIGKDKIIFLYQGEYLKGRGVDSLIELFRTLKVDNTKLVLVLMLYGKKVEEIKERVKNEKNIFMYPKVSIDKYMSYVSCADWGIFLLEGSCKSYNYSLGNKLFDYIMARIPVIVSNLKEMGTFVRKRELGYVVDIKDIQSILKTMYKIDENSHKRYLENIEKVAQIYNWENQEKVLLEIYYKIFFNK